VSDHGADVASKELVAPRVAKVSELASRAGIETLTVSDPPTLRWLGLECCGNSALVISEGEGRPVAAEANRGTPGGWPQISGAPMTSPGEDRLADLATAIATARAVKDLDELDRIRAAAELVEVGHRALYEALEPGRSEHELWYAAAEAIEATSGEPVEAVVDLMVGERTALIGEPPGETPLGAGDPVLFDLAPRREGYWADSCATVACGAPSAALRDRHVAIAAALESGLERARPGATAGAVDAAIREQLAVAGLECPHHTGHGVGVCAQEPPWFVPCSDFLLKQGMVIALEPGAYAEGFGVRLEHLAVIEVGGARPLTHHSLSLFGRG